MNSKIIHFDRKTLTLPFLFSSCIPLSTSRAGAVAGTVPQRPVQPAVIEHRASHGMREERKAASGLAAPPPACAGGADAVTGVAVVGVGVGRPRRRTAAGLSRSTGLEEAGGGAEGDGEEATSIAVGAAAARVPVRIPPVFPAGSAALPAGSFVRRWPAPVQSLAAEAGGSMDDAQQLLDELFVL